MGDQHKDAAGGGGAGGGDDEQPLTLKQFRRLTAPRERQQPRDLVLTLGFRCYKKYDARRKQDMFKGEFYVESLPAQIESVKLLGGLYFAQLPLAKWDWCCFSSAKTAKGSSLFALSQLAEDEHLSIKI